MSNKNIKFFEIEYNYKDNSTAEKRTAIVTDAEYSKKVFMDIDYQIFHYEMDEDYLMVLVEIGSSTFNDFIVYSYKAIESVFEDTKKKDEITSVLIDIFNRIRIETPSNFDIINKYIYDDVCACADKHNWNNSDVEIAFRRWIENK
jgi:hypothetical protein